MESSFSFVKVLSLVPSSKVHGSSQWKDKLLSGLLHMSVHCKRVSTQGVASQEPTSEKAGRSQRADKE